MTMREAFEEVWERGNYRMGSTAHRLVPFLLRYLPPLCTVNDYGSGTGRADVILFQHGYRLNLVDIADNALEEEARSLIGERMTYTVCPLEQLPDEFPVADWGICINVLMTVEPEKLDAILREIRRTCRNLVVEVYDMNDVRMGRNWTTIKENAAWWREMLSRYWREAESVPSPEHPRRYITICRS